MRPTMLSVVTLLLLCVQLPALGQAADAAQATASSASAAPANSPKAIRSPKIENPGVNKETNAPDMVCFGYYPRWSVQFTNGEARYVGFNESDRYFDGEFYWIQDENAWEWRAGNQVPNGHYGLSATIEKAACHDPIQKTSNPYSAQVYLPQGDMVSGCCRKLKPGEAVIGHHGVPPTAAAAPSTSAAAAAPAPQRAPAASKSNTPPAGHPVPVDQY